MQAIIQQEASILNVVLQQLPTLGMLIETGDDMTQITEKMANLLRLQGQPPEGIAILMPHLAGCSARLRGAYGAQALRAVPDSAA
jgi:hypothetical protein